MPELSARMREDWNRRARADARYFVAFGRRQQSEEEFLATAADVVRGLESELRRFGTGSTRTMRALEIGCGPGRLMLPMSRHFAEIHGVDVSDEMVAMAKELLHEVGNAHARVTQGTGLHEFAAESFDFVYSYAVFQHIPSLDVVLDYLREARRVLKPGGLMRCQLNGLPAQHGADTWAGARISAGDLAEFLRAEGWRLLALEGAGTQYMWTTCRKPACDQPGSVQVRIRRITNAHGSEPGAPPRGRFACAALPVDGFGEECDLFAVGVTFSGSSGHAYYLGPRERDGMRQLNVMLPEGMTTGIHAVDLLWRGRVAASAGFRVLPLPPLVPRLLWVSDGIDLLSGTRIVSGTVKFVLEDLGDPRHLHVTLDGAPVPGIEFTCVDPLPPRYEFNFKIRPMRPGQKLLTIHHSAKRIADVWLEFEVSAIHGAR